MYTPLSVGLMKTEVANFPSGCFDNLISKKLKQLSVILSNVKFSTELALSLLIKCRT